MSFLSQSLVTQMRCLNSDFHFTETKAKPPECDREEDLGQATNHHCYCLANRGASVCQNMLVNIMKCRLLSGSSREYKQDKPFKIFLNLVFVFAILG